MTSFLLTLTILISGIALAAPAKSQGTYICQITNSDQTLTLLKIQDLPTSKRSNIDSKARYTMQLQTSELAFPSVETNGIVTTSDIHLNFRSDDGLYQVHLYLDDAAGTLTIGQKEINVTDCRFF